MYLLDHFNYHFRKLFLCFYVTTKPTTKVAEVNIFIPGQQETNELTLLEEKRETLQEELKQENLTPETKTNLEQIIKQLKEKETNLKNIITFNHYLNHLEQEIQTYEKELKENEVTKKLL